MKIFTRRNALIGFLALKAMRRARRNAALGYLAAQGVERTRARRRGGRVLRISLYAALALVTLGIAGGAVARFLRRQPATDEQSFEDVREPVGPVADAGEDLVADAASEVDAASPIEPAPAT